MHPPLAALDRLPELETDRLRLRGLGEADAVALFQVFSDARAMRWWSTPPHRDEAETRAMIEDIAADYERREVLQWGVERRDDERLLGTITLMPAADQPRAELGFILGPEHWGRGYAAEAQARVLDFAFGELALHRLEADVHPDNEASLRSLERLGFRREGWLRERWIVGGETGDSVLLGLLAREWRTGEPGNPDL